MANTLLRHFQAMAKEIRDTEAHPDCSHAGWAQAHLVEALKMIPWELDGAIDCGPLEPKEIHEFQVRSVEILRLIGELEKISCPREKSQDPPEGPRLLLRVRELKKRLVAKTLSLDEQAWLLGALEDVLLQSHMVISQTMCQIKALQRTEEAQAEVYPGE